MPCDCNQTCCMLHMLDNELHIFYFDSLKDHCSNPLNPHIIGSLYTAPTPEILRVLAMSWLFKVLATLTAPFSEPGSSWVSICGNTAVFMLLYLWSGSFSVWTGDVVEETGSILETLALTLTPMATTALAMVTNNSAIEVSTSWNYCWLARSTQRVPSIWRWVFAVTFIRFSQKLSSLKLKKPPSISAMSPKNSC